MTPRDYYERFKRLSYHHEDLGFALDLSRLRAKEAELTAMEPALHRALEQMAALEKGALANPDEKRMVGHYWLRAPQLAPSPEILESINLNCGQMASFVRGIHGRSIKPEKAEAFRHVLMVGIGGSALGPQLVADALATPGDPMKVHFVDNTDPDGIDRTLSSLGAELAATLTVVVSKSGGTKETRNGMLEVQKAYEAAGLSFGRHAAAITQEGSKLSNFAREHSFLEQFPMWDWVGGRTSVMSAVGLLPAALQGIEVGELLDGAKRMDEASREPDPRRNPATLLAAGWHLCGNGHGEKDMVVVPYKDRLQLLSRYLQQLVMESLGKADDLDGKRVHQGITVYGNKGSTDQHAYVQQLLDGPDNFFLTLIEVLRDRPGDESPLEVEPGVTAGDFLAGFLHGTRQALTERGRETILITIDQVDARRLGALIALYERAVGLYATMVHINAYHQPGVESGKRAAAELLKLQAQVLERLRAHPGEPVTAEALAEAIGSDDPESVMRVLRHLAANPHHRVERQPASDAAPWDAKYVTKA
ncbi:MAG: glucose-6-phosphate isomerase [Deltaproteobacteria bacterium]|nr:glucose-6-phosphate isomerase [Deltaproteobacteria bacterium]